MHIDHTVLEKLEKLSHLRIDVRKKEEVIEQLSDILTYVESLGELDTEHLDASFSMLEGGTPMRADIPQGQREIAEDILAHAPRQEDDFFIVPAIIE